MGKRVALTLLIWIFVTEGCIAQRPWSAKRDADFCYVGEYTGIDTIIRIDGYYTCESCDSPYGYSLIFLKMVFLLILIIQIFLLLVIIRVKLK